MNDKQFEESFFKTMRISAIFSGIANREGVASLANEVEDLDDEFYKTGIRSVIKEAKPEFIDKLLSDKIAQTKDKNEIKLKTIQKEAVLMIQTGADTKELLLKLLTYVDKALGDKYMQTQFESDSADKEKEDEDPFNDGPDTPEFKESGLGIITQLDTKALTLLMQEIEITDLAKAMLNAGGTTANKLLRNMPKRAGGMFLEDLEYLGKPSEAEIKDCQQKILAAIHKLIETGKIGGLKGE